MADWLGGTNYFSAPNAIFEREDLRATDKLVYLYLCRRAGSNGTSWPSARRIAKDTSLDVKTVRVCIDRLIGAGLIKKTTRKSEHGDNDTNLYTICHPEGVGESAPHLGEQKDYLGGSVHQVGESLPNRVGEMTPHGGGNGTPEGKPFKENHIEVYSDAGSDGAEDEPEVPEEIVAAAARIVRHWALYNPVSRKAGFVAVQRVRNREATAALLSGVPESVLKQVITELGAVLKPWEIRQEACRRAGVGQARASPSNNGTTWDPRELARELEREVSGR